MDLDYKQFLDVSSVASSVLFTYPQLHKTHSESQEKYPIINTRGNILYEILVFSFLDRHTSGEPEGISEDPNSPQTKHWCFLYSQFLHIKLVNFGSYIIDMYGH